MMSDGAKRPWHPTLSFLRSGVADFVEGPSLPIHTIRWRFNNLKLPGIPLCYVESIATGFGIEAAGLGDGLTFKMAATRALAEAWERLWMYRVSATIHPDVVSSNGFAAGRTIDEAKTSARGELIERAVLLGCWESQRGWRPYSCYNLMTKAVKIWLGSKGWQLDFYILGISNIEVLACLARHSRFGAAFDTKFIGSGTDTKLVETSLIRSILRAISVQEGRDTSPTWRLPDVALPEDHSIFYRDPENLSAFDFIDRSEALGEPPSLTGSEHIRVSGLCETAMLPAVAMAQHDDWPTLRWGRSTVRGGNLWPHPLA